VRQPLFGAFANVQWMGLKKKQELMITDDLGKA
jgi:hypothetical protein